MELKFDLPLPIDHRRDYDTVIGMVTATTQDFIELNHEDYLKFVEDNWDWSREFMYRNSAYSETTRGKLQRLSE